MKAKFLSMLMAVLLLLSGCGETKAITCDGCGKTQEVKASDNRDDSWIIYCPECEATLPGGSQN